MPRLPFAFTAASSLAVVSATMLIGAVALVSDGVKRGSAADATISVNSTANTVANDGLCTLTEAITSANTDTASGAMLGECAGDYSNINFSIPTTDSGYNGVQGFWTISAPTLPAVSSPTTIDAYTQPGAVVNTNGGRHSATNAQPKIVLDGQSNTSIAMTITGGDSFIRGLVFANWGFGIKIQTNGGNNIEGNFFGTNAAGTTRAPFGFVAIDVTSSGNVIGGSGPEKRNIISAAGNGGVLINDATQNTVIGNLIGTDATGTQAFGNGFGILVGGISIGNNIYNNVISGNNYGGMLLHASGTIVQGNIIGTSVDRVTALPNGESGGINIDSGSSFTYVGGPDQSLDFGDVNLIAFNVGPGISVGASGNAFQNNSIHSNGRLGIDLMSPPGVPNDNDPGDVDFGPNQGQNYPVITAVEEQPLHIEGTLDSTANTEFRLEFFGNESCDASGFGEGQVPIAAQLYTTDADGVIDWTLDSNTGIVGPTYVTATATNMTLMNTSEFSGCFFVPGPATPSPTPSPTLSPSPTASASPSATPSPTGTPAGPLLGDADCDGEIDTSDVVTVLAGVSDTGDPAGCTAASGVTPLNTADADCDGLVTPLDALNILLHIADLPALPLPSGCPAVGDTF